MSEFWSEVNLPDKKRIGGKHFNTWWIGDIHPSNWDDGDDEDEEEDDFMGVGI